MKDKVQKEKETKGKKNDNEKEKRKDQEESEFYALKIFVKRSKVRAIREKEFEKYLSNIVSFNFETCSPFTFYRN